MEGYRALYGYAVGVPVATVGDQIRASARVCGLAAPAKHGPQGPVPSAQVGVVARATGRTASALIDDGKELLLQAGLRDEGVRRLLAGKERNHPSCQSLAPL